jgi:pimeloyl-ACP methyl ester carboxylesterase
MHVYKKQLEATLAHDVCNRLGRITVPTLVLGGDADLLNPVEKLHELAANIPRAQLHVYPELGHGFMFEARDDVARRILEFLDGVPMHS